MSRAPFQVLVLLRRPGAEETEYLVLKRSGTGAWQGIAGGGENDESPREAAARETLEETGITVAKLTDLQSVSMIPVLEVTGCYQWGDLVLEIPEHAFFADVDANTTIQLSGEHTEYRWCSAREALDLLEWESNRKALRASELMAPFGASVDEQP